MTEPRFSFAKKRFAAYDSAWVNKRGDVIAGNEFVFQRQ